MSRRVLYRLLFKLVLTRIDAERTHELGLGLLRVALAAGPVRALARRLVAPRDPALRVGTLGLDLPSPLGVAAGFDKGASAFEQLAALGFGFVEIGTVTAQEQPGNDRPRIVRLPRDRALVNRMGFPNPGAPAVAARLARRRGGGAIVGVNVGKTKRVADDEIGDDYRDAVRRLAPGADYVVLNVSSPNTPGLRAVQTVDRLRALIEAARPPAAPGRRRVPVLVKIAPDLVDADIDAIADLAVELELDGIVAVNTTDHPRRAALRRRGDRRRGRRRPVRVAPARASARGAAAAARTRRRPARAHLRRRDRDARRRARPDPRGRNTRPGLHGLRVRRTALAVAHEPCPRAPGARGRRAVGRRARRHRRRLDGWTVSPRATAVTGTCEEGRGEAPNA